MSRGNTLFFLISIRFNNFQLFPISGDLTSVMEDGVNSCPYLSLIVPCYNEAATLKKCIERCLELVKKGIKLEIIIVNDCSTDESGQIAEDLARSHPEIVVYNHVVNQGKGAALHTGFTHARGDYIGIQDADNEYDPLDYLELLNPLLSGKADVVFGSRYLRQDKRRVLYFWHTWMNRSLTFVSNMFTNLDLTDMETCYKLFTAETIKKIVPQLKEKRFGFEPEVTTLVAINKCRVYECAIHYEPRTYEEGKKIGWRDGLRALYCILHYGAPYAAIPMQLLLYFFIGACCALANICCFVTLLATGLSVFWAVILSFAFSATLNYILCIAILFRHKARWSGPGELGAYIVCVILMCALDYLCTAGLLHLGLAPFWSKAWAALIGFFGNFYLRKYIIF